MFETINGASSIFLPERIIFEMVLSHQYNKTFYAIALNVSDGVYVLHAKVIRGMFRMIYIFIYCF